MPTVKEIKKELDKLEVNYDPKAKKADLSALLDKALVESPDNVNAEVEAPKIELKSDPKGDFNVYKITGVFVRAYSHTVHGKHAKELAKEFALKNRYVVK